MVYIYGLVCPLSNTIRYIGKAKDVKARLRQHLSLKRQSHNNLKMGWIRALSAKGLKPSVLILEEVPDDEWQKAERKWIAHFKKENTGLTNLTEGGEGYPLTSEIIEKIRASKLGKPRPPSVGEAVRKARLGKRTSDETKAKLSAATKGRPRPQEVKDKISRSHVGIGHTDETRDKLRSLKMGTKRSGATSSYIGVFYARKKSKWITHISVDGRQSQIGRFDSEIEAAQAYDKAALKHFGPQAKLNFPNETDPE